MRGRDVGLKDIGYTIGDVARTGLVVGRKIAARARADAKDLESVEVRSLVDRLHPEKIGVRVAEIVDETASTKTLRVVPSAGAYPPFRAGQYANLYLTIDGVATSRPFSFASPPTRPDRLDITVRRMPGGFVSSYLLDRATVGEEFELSGPAGDICYEPLKDTKDQVFLAGGSGITAFMSMIRHKADAPTGRRMHLIYGSRVPDDVIFGEELDALASKLDNLSVDVVISEPPDGYDGLTGFMDAKMIKRLVGDASGKTFYLCGPLAMYDFCTQALAELGVPARRVKTELQGPPQEVMKVEGWPTSVKAKARVTVTIESTGRAFEVPCTEPLLNSLERNGIVPPTLCRSGACAYCKTRLVEGEVFIPPTVTLRKSDADFGFIHPCMSYPTSDITIRF